MKISKIKIVNFRLLEDVTINLEEDTTIIIGRNNSGKTSFFEAIKMLTSKGEEELSFEDFAQSSYQRFNEGLELFNRFQTDELNEEGQEQLEIEIKEKTPSISLTIEITYETDPPDSLVHLSHFISDLDVNRNDGIIHVTYSATDSLRLFKAFLNREDKTEDLIPFLQKNLKQYYKLRCYALEDFDGQGRKREVEGNYRDKIERVVSFEDIKALRVLDDKKGDRSNTLALGFSKYYNQRDESSDDVKQLEQALSSVEEDLTLKYGKVLERIISDLEKFGANSPVQIPPISIDSEFKSEDVIKKNIKYYYKQDEIDLPESYNGLGYSNLIYMVLEIASFVEKLKNSKEEKVSEFLVIMIEEPEAHMHPQMQRVFISNVKGILDEAKKEGIDVQLILTTHSSHIISEAGIDVERGFNRIRYFNKTTDGIVAQDFNQLRIKDDTKTFRFLKQYLTLHKCDLFFADKVIMVEGTTERMLLPLMVKKVSPLLTTEYVSILEVGGAYTHKFKELLDFIKVKTLIITDLDSVEATGHHKKCPVNDGLAGEITSNATLKDWIPKKTSIADLISCDLADKTEDERIMVAYQVKEESSGSTARSFEESFLIKNKNLLSQKDETGDQKDGEEDCWIKDCFVFFQSITIDDFNSNSEYTVFENMSSKDKTNFAFDILSFDEATYGQWEVPKYIKEGLEWLGKSSETNEDSDGSN